MVRTTWNSYTAGGGQSRERSGRLAAGSGVDSTVVVLTARRMKPSVVIASTRNVNEDVVFFLGFFLFFFSLFIAPWYIFSNF